MSNRKKIDLGRLARVQARNLVQDSKLRVLAEQMTVGSLEGTDLSAALELPEVHKRIAALPDAEMNLTGFLE